MEVLRILVKNMERKKQIRQEYKEIRKNLTEEQMQIWSEKICYHLVQWELFLHSKTIYFYYPLGNEVNLLPLAARALKMGKTIAFPKTEGEEIAFYRVRNMEEFKEGAFHVMEPLSTELLTCENPLILTPGVVFDNKKNRMGYGKGYYDRYISRFREAIPVGIGYEIQIAQDVPADSMDIPMKYIITEKRVW